MKFVLIPDSFKGTMSSLQICGILREKIRQHFPDSEIISVPVADGGEGSVDAFLAAVGGHREYVTVKNPFFEDMTACYGLLGQGDTAVIEMAACAGLGLAEERKNPMITTTYGVGQLMLAAAERGVKKIILGLGGSCTNDGGCGAAAAAGIRFYDAYGRSFVPTGGTLKDIARIDVGGKHPVFEGIEIITMCDIDNPMYGPGGAAAVFGPQKGADEDMVQELDRGLRHLGEKISAFGKDISRIPGTGAAGAMGAGMMAFFGSKLKMGIETVLDIVGFDDMIRDADYIFTGEGNLDGQSLHGKAVIGIAKRAKPLGKTVIAVVGGARDQEIQKAYDMGVTAVFPINRLPLDFSVSRYQSEENLAYTVDNVLRMIDRRNA